VLYNFRGGGSEVLLYNVIWGKGVVKKSTFLCYIICGCPHTTLFDAISHLVQGLKPPYYSLPITIHF